jgi:hypothetical protein
VNDTRPDPSTRALLHRLRGATQAYLEICQDVTVLLRDRPEAGAVFDQLIEAVRDQGSMGTARSLADAVEDAIARMGSL